MVLKELVEMKYKLENKKASHERGNSQSNFLYKLLLRSFPTSKEILEVMRL